MRILLQSINEKVSKSMRAILVILLMTMTAVLSLSACSKETMNSQEPISSDSEYEIDRLVKYRTGEPGWLDELIASEANLSFSELEPIELETLKDEANNAHRYALEVMSSAFGYGNIVYKGLVRVNDSYLAAIEKLRDEKTEVCAAIIQQVQNSTTVGTKERRESILNTMDVFFFDPVRRYEYSDFADVQSGDQVEKLCRIDPSFRYDLIFAAPSKEEYDSMILWFKDHRDATKEDYTVKEKIIYKALEDGILTVIFDAVDNRIKDISFHSSAEPEAQKYVRIRDGSFINKVFPNH